MTRRVIFRLRQMVTKMVSLERPSADPRELLLSLLQSSYPSRKQNGLQRRQTQTLTTTVKRMNQATKTCPTMSSRDADAVSSNLQRRKQGQPRGILAAVNLAMKVPRLRTTVTPLTMRVSLMKIRDCSEHDRSRPRLLLSPKLPRRSPQ